VLFSYEKGPRMGLNGPYGYGKSTSAPLSYGGSDSYRQSDFLCVLS